MQNGQIARARRPRGGDRRLNFQPGGHAGGNDQRPASGGDPADSQSESESLTELRNSDNQLYEALTLLRGINLLTPQTAPDNESMVSAEASDTQTDEDGEA